MTSFFNATIIFDSILFGSKWNEQTKKCTVRCNHISNTILIWSQLKGMIGQGQLHSNGTYQHPHTVKIFDHNWTLTEQHVKIFLFLFSALVHIFEVAAVCLASKNCCRLTICIRISYGFKTREKKITFRLLSFISRKNSTDTSE